MTYGGLSSSLSHLNHINIKATNLAVVSAAVDMLGFQARTQNGLGIGLLAQKTKTGGKIRTGEEDDRGPANEVSKPGRAGSSIR